MNGKKNETWRILAFLLMLWDFVTVGLSYFLALWFRFDCSFAKIPHTYFDVFIHFIPFYSVICIIVYALFHQYRSIWRFASYIELSRCIYSVLITIAIHVIGITLVCQYMTGRGRMPSSYYLVGVFLQLFFSVSIRFSYRMVNMMWGKSKHRNGSRVMLFGAGYAGQMILRDINHTHKNEEQVVCILDDDPNKWHRFIDGVPVVGGRDDILKAVEQYGVKKIYLAIPSVSVENKRDILQICSETGCELKQLPGIYQLASGEVSVSSMKNVSVEDLLGREPIRADLSEVFQFIQGKRVLVTGGGGSIGSELCRQIAAHGPSQLIILDIYENNAYDISLELREKYPSLNLVVLIGSVRDSRKMFDIFELYHPQIVYHAAAHKHVPLMEDSPCESIKNNVFGTYKTAYAAMYHHCERFVLISTDKAVNPTNIMGASKRLCEMIIQAFDKKVKEGAVKDIPQLFTHESVEMPDKNGLEDVFKDIQTEFVAVRFGNVLGSNGSVIPIFRKQIEKGGPVKVTHPDIIRYFMTIPEAVSLVMLAGTYAHGGEIFVLDMGSPVKIDTLARNMIKLSGFKPDVDIKIEYTGLRPGEKLYEEKLMAEEGLQTTENQLIHIGKPIPFDEEVFLDQLSRLMDVAYKNKESIIRPLVMSIVETYRPEGGIPGAVKDDTYKQLAREALPAKQS